MLYLWHYPRLLVQFLFALFCIHRARAPWPSSDSSSIKLLGLFPDPPNASKSETTSLSVHSRAMFQAAMVLSHQLNLTVENQLIGWEALQTGGDMIDAQSNACRAISTSKIVGIVGPGYSTEAHGIAPFSKTIGIPAISYSATDPHLSDKNAYLTFYRTVPSDRTAARAIAKLFLRYNWTSSIIIYQNDGYGSGGFNAMSSALIENNLSVSDTLIFDTVTLNFYGDFKAILTNSVSRIVVLWVTEVHVDRILQRALDHELLAPKFLWILGSNADLSVFDQSSYSKLNGIMTVIPAVGSVTSDRINRTLLDAAYGIWEQYEPETFPGPTKVDSYGMFAFDATWSLIQALSKLCSSVVNDTSVCLSVVNSSFCFDYRFLNTESFLRIMNTVEFLGVSGPLKFSNTTTDRINGNYYVVQNIQPSSNGIGYTSVLKYTDSTGWQPMTLTDVIVWPGDSLVPFTDRPGLSGVTLRIGVIVAPPFTILTNITNGSGKNITQMGGYMIDLIDLLQAQMNFTPEIVVNPPQTTYNEAVRGVVNNVYDILVADVSILAERREFVDFSNTIYDNSIRIITRKESSTSLDIFSYLQPFSGRLWLVLFIALLYSSALVFLLEREENADLREKSMISSLAMSIWFAFGAMTGFGVDFHVRTAAGRLLCMGLYILSIILVATYTANLASTLTLSKANYIISGIDDIKNGKIPYSRIGVLVGSSLEVYYLREVSSGGRNFYPLKSVDEIYTLLLNKTIDASIMDAGNLEYAVNVFYCNLTLVGADFGPSSYGIVMPKRWPYAQALDIAVLSIREKGALDDLKRKWFTAKVCADSAASDTSASIEIISVAGLFLTFFVITLLALLLFLWLKGDIISRYLKPFISRAKRVPEGANVPENRPDLNGQIEFSCDNLDFAHGRGLADGFDMNSQIRRL